MKRLLLLLAMILVISCQRRDTIDGESAREGPHSYKIVSPAGAVEAGKPARFSLAGSFSGKEAIQWNAIGARIEGPADGPQVTIVATQAGTITVGCTIQAHDTKPVAIATNINVGAAGPAVIPERRPGIPEINPGTATSLKIEDAGFVPSGFMGDISALKVEQSPERPHSGSYSQKWGYRPKSSGPGWAAVAWQYPENNWGDRPGKNLSANQYRSVTVWARGVRDPQSRTLPKVQFKAGGATDPAKRYQASFEVVGDFVTLTEDWMQYSLDLTGQNLSQVIAAFVVVIRAQDVGPTGATFYLSDIEYVR